MTPIYTPPVSTTLDLVLDTTPYTPPDPNLVELQLIPLDTVVQIDTFTMFNM